MQDMAKILRNVQCLLLGLKDLTWQPHTAQLVSGHNTNIIYVTELKNMPQGACTQLVKLY